jgi:uncharacterized protein (TIGR02996 family)
VSDARVGVNDVKAAREAGDWERALGLALERWREKRAGVISAALVGLSAQAAREYAAPKERINKDFHARWLDAAKSAWGRAWALGTITHQLPGSDLESRATVALVERCRALVRTGPDPRSAEAALNLLAQATPLAGWTSSNSALAAVFVANADARVVGLVAAAQAKSPMDLPRKVTKLRALEVPLEADEEAAWRALLPARAPTQDPAALLAEIAKAPGDDGPRAVLADLLQERGDPQGEFIALQLEEAANHDPAKRDAKAVRAQELLKEHGRTWLGPLAQVVERAEFRRGLLYSIELGGAWAADERYWHELASDPRLATVSHVGHGAARADLYADFVSSKALSALESLEVFDDRILPVLEARRDMLREVSCTLWKRVSLVQRFTDRVLPILERCPRVVRLRIDSDLLEPLRKSALFARVEKLALIGDLQRWLAQITSRPSDFPEALSLVLEDSSCEIEMPPGRVARVTVAPIGWIDSVVKDVRKLPLRYERLEVAGPKRTLAALQKAFARRKGFEIVAAASHSGLLTGIRK